MFLHLVKGILTLFSHTDCPLLQNSISKVLMRQDCRQNLKCLYFAPLSNLESISSIFLWFIPQTPTIVQCWNMSQTGARIQYESLVELQESNCLNCHPPPLTVHNNRELELRTKQRVEPRHFNVRCGYNKQCLHHSGKPVSASPFWILSSNNWISLLWIFTKRSVSCVMIGMITSCQIEFNLKLRIFWPSTK